MENSALSHAATVPNKIFQKRIKRVHTYTIVVTLTGLCISIYALAHLPYDKVGLVLFVVMAILAEITNVELFDSSHSKVSMSSVITIASIMSFGPLAGVITYLVSGLATAIKSDTSDHKQRASLILRTTFNAGMWTITAFVAGNLYVLLGGTPGDVLKLSNAFPLILMAGAEYSLNVFLLIGVISLQTGQRPRELWERDFQWQSLVSIAGGVLGGAFLALAYDTFGILGIVIVLLPILSTSYAFRLYKNNMKVYVEGLETLNHDLKDALVALEQSNLELTDANHAIRRLNAELFHSLAKVFDMRDPYVGGHAAQVAIYAVAIATEMGLPPERMEVIRQSAYLHDIGKLAIPEAILHKPGKLTDIEYEFIKKHTDIGADLLSSTEGLKHLAPFIRHHHERWDGHGYPLGLAGEAIPLESRILNVCDSVESMASDRPYHRGMSTGAIIDEVRRCSMTQFDPEVVSIFVRLIQRHGPAFVVNSARSVTQQYAASLLANENLARNMFAWVFENNVDDQMIPVKSPSTEPQMCEVEPSVPFQPSPRRFRLQLPPL
jgi:putative nucleotidyltransferase with HDIG domain